METESCKTKTKMDFFYENKNGNGTVFSGGTDVETEIPFPANMEFPF